MKVKKSYEITDAKISFVSLVDKAANKKQFIITKAEDGEASFTSSGKILKVDDVHHYVTGIVYEPMIEDAHGNFMTEDEIIKAAYWFAKNGDNVDLQHSFEALSDATVVENWVTKSDTRIDNIEITKGTWLMTVEVTDSDVWDKIQKGELTGFSMGGVGKYSEDDVDLNNIEKGDNPKSMNTENNTEKKGIFKKLAEAFGLEVIEKGAMTEEFNKRTRSNQFWSAFSTLEDLLRSWDWRNDTYVFETDEETIRTALEEFSTILTGILTQDSITKAITAGDMEITKSAVIKSGKKMSIKNKTKLDEISQALSDFTKEFDDNNQDDEEEEKDVQKDDIQKMIDEAVQKAIEKAQGEEPTTEPAANGEEVTADDIQKMIDAAITKAVAPILKSRGLPNNLNEEQEIEKQENQHYLSGIL